MNRFYIFATRASTGRLSESVALSLKAVVVHSLHVISFRSIGRLIGS